MALSPVLLQLIRRVVQHAFQCLLHSQWDSRWVHLAWGPSKGGGVTFDLLACLLSYVESLCQLLCEGPLQPNTVSDNSHSCTPEGKSLSLSLFPPPPSLRSAVGCSCMWWRYTFRSCWLLELTWYDQPVGVASTAKREGVWLGYQLLSLLQIPSECSLSLLKPFCHLLASTRE